MADSIQERILEEVADLHGVPAGAYNIRANGQTAGRNTTANIDIVTKTDKPGIDIRIKPGTRNESVHIPVVVSASGLKEMVYNDFFIGEDSDVVIVAGCGIHNCGDQDSGQAGIRARKSTWRKTAAWRWRWSRLRVWIPPTGPIPLSLPREPSL